MTSSRTLSQGRMALRSTWMGLVALSLIAAVTVLGAPTANAVGPFTDYTAPNAQGMTPCPTVAVVAFVGSGESPTAGAGLGGPVQAFTTELVRQLPGKTVGTSAVTYPAVPWLIPPTSSSLWSILASIGGTLSVVASNVVDFRYPQSVLTGGNDGSSDITHLAVRCPTTKIIAAGYSQGGQALRSALAKLNNTTAKRVSAVVLFADAGLIAGESGVHFLLPSGPNPDSGIGVGALGQMPLGSRYAGRVVSDCKDVDPICQFTAGHLSTIGVHLSYGSSSDAYLTASWTKQLLYPPSGGGGGAGGGTGSFCEAFVSDVTIPDGTYVAPGQPLTKSWALRNCGSASWSGATATRVSGTLGPASIPVPALAAGATGVLSASFTASTSPGHYRSIYRMTSSTGVAAAGTFWVDVNVSGSSDCEAFVADLTVPDGTAVAASAGFTKSWRLRNCGTTDWSGLTAVRTSGSFGPASFAIPATAPGASVDISVPMSAPAAAGHFRSTYRLQGADGHFAANSFWVDVNVSGSTDCEAFVADLTVPDGTAVAANVGFTKSWRLRNCGTTDWSGLTAVRTSGSFGPASFAIPATAPGATSDIGTSMSAPAAAGNYRSTYRLQGADGHFADNSFWVDINVVAGHDCEAFVADLTVPDGTAVAANVGFTKSWRLRNCGTTDWSGLTAVRTSGSFGPASFAIPATAPGATSDIGTSMSAPAAAGNYRSTYRLLGCRRPLR